jgi:hypothetical protein
MRSLTLIVAALAVMLLRLGATAPALAQTGCGADRPDVQTLTDANAGDIDTNQLIGVNLSTLASLPIPEGVAAGTRYNPYETTVWETLGQLVQAQLDPSGAIDVTLSDPEGGDTITVVFPDAADCAGSADPAMLQLMEQARAAFLQAYGAPPASGVQPLSGTVEVAGVGFIAAGSSADQGGTGSGIELSPVLAFAPAGPLSPASPAPAESPSPVSSSPAGG